MPGAYGRAYDAGNMVGPVGIKASVEPEFQMLFIGVLGDLHRRLSSEVGTLVFCRRKMRRKIRLRGGDPAIRVLAQIIRNDPLLF